ncbi:hypothetical protein NQ314_007815, partial [Rhamnusium bicolor]
GNPRNKCALQPGHSLMDWIRLGSSGKDLTGVGPRAGQMSVTRHELSLHNKESDAWLAIRGKVYNITEYLPFHPGGPEELMKGAGIDATRLFEQPNVDREALFFENRNTSPKHIVDADANASVASVSVADADVVRPPVPVFKSPEVISETQMLPKEESTSKEGETGNKVDDIPSLPRFDWIQRIDWITSVNWPCSIKMVCETGKVEFIFRKTEGKIWDNYGVLRQQSKTVNGVVNGVKFNFVLTDKKTSQEMSRSYTPVPQSLFTGLALNEPCTDSLCLMIKRYENGNVSKFLTDREKSDVIHVTKPIGDFELIRIEKKESFVLLAAGTGITPMMTLLIFLLERRVKKCQFIRLLFFNKTEQDIPFKDQLENLERRYSKLRINHILSESDENWTGLTGHINKEMIDNAIQEHIRDTGYTIAHIFCFVCGPNPFVALSIKELQQLGVTDNQIYSFQG